MTSSGSSDSSSPRSDDIESSSKLLKTESTKSPLPYTLNTLYFDPPNTESSSDQSSTPPSLSNNDLNEKDPSNDISKTDPSSYSSHSITPELSPLSQPPDVIELDKDLLQRQVFARRAKLRKQPLLKLLESLNLDISAYYQYDKAVKSNKSSPASRGRKSTQSSFLPPENKTISNQPSPVDGSASPTITSTSPSHLNSSNAADDEGPLDTSSIAESVNVQKEDSLLWINQQINYVKKVENLGDTVYFHQLLLADSAQLSNNQSFKEYRNVDKIEPPAELDEILCLLRCAGKIFVTEIIALAQLVEQGEQMRKQKISFPESISPTQSHFKKQKLKDNFDRVSIPKTISKSVSSSPRVLLPKHIYEAMKKLRGIE